MKQLHFIKENISQTNARRLIVTDPEIQRDEVIFQHTEDYETYCSYLAIIAHRS